MLEPVARRSSVQWTLLSLAGAMSACGGESIRREPPGTDAQSPVHVGYGAYDLFIRTLTDDCSPRFVSGEMGLVLVVVRLNADGFSGGLNLPYYGAIDSTFGFAPAREDVRFPEPLGSDVPVSVYPCGDATEHYEFAVTSLSGERIVVHVVYSIDGLENCSGALGDATKDCTADRSYEFTWRHACADENGSSGCQ